MQDQTDPATILKPHLVLHQGQAMTTSMAVAEHFGKLHKDVLKALKNLECSTDFTQRNFALCFNNNALANGKRIPYYRMTRDGFVFLAMGFTGKAAAAWKEAYIGAFNRMEQALIMRLREEGARAEQAFLEERGQLIEMVETLIERVDVLNEQVRRLFQDRHAIASDLDFIKRRITGPEELGVMMILCDMRAPDAQLLAFLIRKVYEESQYHQTPVTASAYQLSRAIGWESVQQVRDALKRLESKELIQIDRESRGMAASYSVRTRDIERRLQAHCDGMHGRANTLALVPDAESPIADKIRKLVGLPQGEHDAETERLIEERNQLPGVWKSFKVH